VPRGVIARLYRYTERTSNATRYYSASWRCWSCAQSIDLRCGSRKAFALARSYTLPIACSSTKAGVRLRERFVAPPQAQSFRSWASRRRSIRNSRRPQPRSVNQGHSRWCSHHRQPLRGALSTNGLQGLSGAQFSIKSLKYKRDLEKDFGCRATHYRRGLPRYHVSRVVHSPSLRPHHGPPAPLAVGTGPRCTTMRVGRRRSGSSGRRCRAGAGGSTGRARIAVPEPSGERQCVGTLCSDLIGIPRPSASPCLHASPHGSGRRTYPQFPGSRMEYSTSLGSSSRAAQQRMRRHGVMLVAITSK